MNNNELRDENVIELLKKYNACLSAMEWAQQYDTFGEAWDNCHRS